MYKPLKIPVHHDIFIRGLNYRVTTWGEQSGIPVYLLHGWADVGMAFQFVADGMDSRWYLIAPDWRGFGDTQWNASGYWFPDYLADLEAIITHFSPEQKVKLVGHSMGGNIAWMYAGIRPKRISHAVSLDVIGMPDSNPENASAHYAKWLEQITSELKFASYPNIDKVIEQIQQLAPRLGKDEAQFLASYWTSENASGQYPIKHDPAHKRVNPVLYRRQEAVSCWKQIAADVLLLMAKESRMYRSYTSEGYQDEIKQAINRFTEIIVEDSGHMLHLEQPGQVATVLDAFLKR